MNTSVQQIDSLEVECKRNLVLNLSWRSQSTTSNYRMSTISIHLELKEDDIVHQMLKDTDIGN
jgi:hypothetical protein